MPDTKIAIRRLPFPVGTKMVFAQASVPTDWTLDASDDDRFLRVVSGFGAGVGGPDNTSLSSVNLTHTHGLGGHAHNMSSHDHVYSHSHSFPSSQDGADGRTGGMAGSGGNENSSNYRVSDNNAWYYRSDGHHMQVNGGSADEGDHDHFLGSISSVSAITGGSNTTNTGGPSGSSSSEKNVSSSLNHNHSIDSNFRPRYFDVVVGELVG